MSKTIRRRTFLQLAGAAAAFGAAMSALPSFAADRRLRVFWWGGQDRQKRTLAAMAAYAAKNPGLTTDGESVAFADFITRLSTQVAGGNPPDLFQMDYRYITEYARNGVLEPLDGYIGTLINFGDWDKASIDSCRVDGKLYAINLGNNTDSLFFDTEAYGKAGIKDIPLNTSWKDYFAMAAEVTKANGGKYYGSTDSSGRAKAFENWLRQMGKDMYGDKALGHTADDLAAWFQLWADARTANAVPPADVTALDKDGPDSNMIALGYAATTFSHTNNLVAYQGATKKQLGITLYPQGAGPNPGNYLKPSQMWSISSKSANKEDAIKLANYTVNDPEGVKAFGVERGVPASASMRTAVEEVISPVDKLQLEFIGKVGNSVGELPPPPPSGAAQIEDMLLNISQQVAFGAMSAQDAAKQYFDSATAIVAKG